MTDNTDLIAQLTRRADEMEAIADTAGLRSSWYLEGAAALRKAARDNRRAVKALTAVAPGVRVPTDAQVNSACLSYRHDFGLLPDEQRKTVMFQAREWLHAWQKELPAALDIPAVAPAVRALEWEESVKGRWIGTAPVKLGNLAFWIFQSENGYLRHIAGQGAVTSPTLEAAQLSAQADYEARILAALEIGGADNEA